MYKLLQSITWILPGNETSSYINVRANHVMEIGHDGGNTTDTPDLH